MLKIASKDTQEPTAIGSKSSLELVLERNSVYGVHSVHLMRHDDNLFLYKMLVSLKGDRRQHWLAGNVTGLDKIAHLILQAFDNCNCGHADYETWRSKLLKWKSSPFTPLSLYHIPV
ncbi:hypothetical protein [Neptuniibacter sp. QD37_11]|uniref:hypothetical protein n=1 Tax=Neptuniibacter sp. QD37_11 TaxID=3398209 RepID=UPI0039F47A98